MVLSHLLLADGVLLSLSGREARCCLVHLLCLSLLLCEEMLGVHVVVGIVRLLSNAAERVPEAMLHAQLLVCLVELLGPILVHVGRVLLLLLL